MFAMQLFAFDNTLQIDQKDLSEHPGFEWCKPGEMVQLLCWNDKRELAIMRIATFSNDVHYKAVFGRLPKYGESLSKALEYRDQQDLVADINEYLNTGIVRNPKGLLE